LTGGSGPAWGEFDPSWYLARYPDVRLIVPADDPGAVLRYYLITGQGIGHSPNRYFDEAWYLRQHQPAAASVSNGDFASGFDEYCQVGYTGRSPHWLYDEVTYRALLQRATGEEFTLTAGGFANLYDQYLRQGSRDASVVRSSVLSNQARCDGGRSITGGWRFQSLSASNRDG
jgi:hypothetical protein